LKFAYANSSRQSFYIKKATRSTSVEDYNEETRYRSRYLRQRPKAYSEDLTYQDRNITSSWVREKATVIDMIKKNRRGNGPGKSTQVEYKITDGHHIAPFGNPNEGNIYREEDRRDYGETN